MLQRFGHVKNIREALVSEQLIFQTPSAYGYPLLVKNLLQAPVVSDPRQ